MASVSQDFNPDDSINTLIRCGIQYISVATLGKSNAKKESKFLDPSISSVVDAVVEQMLLLENKKSIQEVLSILGSIKRVTRLNNAKADVEAFSKATKEIAICASRLLSPNKVPRERPSALTVSMLFDKKDIP